MRERDSLKDEFSVGKSDVYTVYTECENESVYKKKARKKKSRKGLQIFRSNGFGVKNAAEFELRMCFVIYVQRLPGTKSRSIVCILVICIDDVSSSKNEPAAA